MAVEDKGGRHRRVTWLEPRVHVPHWQWQIHPETRNRHNMPEEGEPAKPQILSVKEMYRLVHEGD